MDARARTEAITAQVSETLAGSGVVVDEVVVQPAGRRRLVRVFVARDVSDLLAAEDGTTGVDPLSLDEIAEVTRTISESLDDSDVMGEAPYTLEVSSPGVDRPLTTRAHFRRNVGRLLTVRLADDRTLTGRLTAAGADGVVLAEHPDPVIAWEEITSATVQVEFSRPEGKDA